MSMKHSTSLLAITFLLVPLLIFANISSALAVEKEKSEFSAISNDGFTVRGKTLKIQQYIVESIPKNANLTTEQIRSNATKISNRTVSPRTPPELSESQRLGCQLIFDITDRQTCINQFSQCRDGLRNIPTISGSNISLASCPMPTEPPAQIPASPGADPEPVIIYLSVEDFDHQPIQPPTAQIGPPAGYLPVGADNISYAEGGGEQIFNTTILDTPVAIRAVPVKYEWHFGDGTILTTDFPGRPYPKRDVAMRYEYEGWYEAYLLTTYAGEFSVDEGPWQPILGTVTRESGRTWIYSDVRTARLVQPGTVTAEDNQIPERTDETLGPINEDAEVKTLKRPRTDGWWVRNR